LQPYGPPQPLRGIPFFSKELKVYLLYIQEAVLFTKEDCNCVVNKQVHITQEIIITVVGMHII
jgi:hypothetical protein